MRQRFYSGKLSLEDGVVPSADTRSEINRCANDTDRRQLKLHGTIFFLKFDYLPMMEDRHCSGKRFDISRLAGRELRGWLSRAFSFVWFRRNIHRHLSPFKRVLHGSLHRRKEIFLRILALKNFTQSCRCFFHECPGHIPSAHSIFYGKIANVFHCIAASGKASTCDAGQSPKPPVFFPLSNRRRRIPRPRCPISRLLSGHRLLNLSKVISEMFLQFLLPSRTAACYLKSSYSSSKAIRFSYRISYDVELIR